MTSIESPVDCCDIVIFLGINDCGSTDSDELEFVIETILDTVHDLYVKAGARKFIFVNVPPIDRSPQGMICRCIYLSGAYSTSS